MAETVLSRRKLCRTATIRHQRHGPVVGAAGSHQPVVWSASPGLAVLLVRLGEAEASLLGEALLVVLSGLLLVVAGESLLLGDALLVLVPP